MGEHVGFKDGVLIGHGFYVTPRGTGRHRDVPIPVRVCVRCGSLVADEDVHDIFHRDVAGAVS